MSIIATVTGEREGGTLKPLTGVWVWRDRGYKFLVSPYGDNKETVYVSSPEENFKLPDGRYAFVFGNEYYDFLVGRGSSNGEHCVVWEVQNLVVNPALSIPSGKYVPCSSAQTAPSAASTPLSAPKGGAKGNVSAKSGTGGANPPNSGVAGMDRAVDRGAALQTVLATRPQCEWREDGVIDQDHEGVVVPYDQLQMTKSDGKGLFGSEKLYVQVYSPPYAAACILIIGSYEEKRELYDRTIAALRVLGVRSKN